MLREYGGILDEVSQIVDLCLLTLGFYFTVGLYAREQMIKGQVLEQYLFIFLVFIVSWIVTSNINRLYQSRRFMSGIGEALRLIKSHLLSFGITISIGAIYEPLLIGNRFLFYFAMVALTLTLGMHLIIRLILQAWRSMGRNTRYVLIIGNGKAAKTYLNKINNTPQLGYQVLGYLANEKNGLQIPYLGDYANLETVVGSKVVDIVVVTAPLSEEAVKRCVELLGAMGKTVAVLLDDTIAKVARSRPIDFGGLPMVAYDGRPRLPWQEFTKRLVDVAFTGLGLVALSPILIAIAIAVKISSQGPVIFSQERVGLNGRTFLMYKFRTMVVNAEELKDTLTHLNEMSGPVFKIKNDPRVTSVGRLLRKTSMDELPQLWNVLRGDMSLVGPRPPLPSEVDLYDTKHRKRLAVRPGITCIWQISGRNDIDFDQWMDMDAEYIDRWSLWMDIEILAKTVPVVLLRKGAS